MLLSETNILYTKKMEIDETNGNDGHVYRLRIIDEVQEILIAEREREGYTKQT